MLIHIKMGYKPETALYRLRFVLFTNELWENILFHWFLKLKRFVGLLYPEENEPMLKRVKRDIL